MFTTSINLTGLSRQRSPLICDTAMITSVSNAPQFAQYYPQFQLRKTVNQHFISLVPFAMTPVAADGTNLNSAVPPPPPRRALGVDYGRKQVGLAVSTLGLAPRPLTNLRGGGLEMLMVVAQGVLDAAVQEGCDCIVIGLPVTSTGTLRQRQTDSQQGRRCRNFADAVAALSQTKNVHIYLVDERGTTVQAEALVYAVGGGRNEQKRKKDCVAAALILSVFFGDVDAAVKVKPPRVSRGARNLNDTSGGSGSLQGEDMEIEKVVAEVPRSAAALLLSSLKRDGSEKRNRKE